MIATRGENSATEEDVARVNSVLQSIIAHFFQQKSSQMFLNSVEFPTRKSAGVHIRFRKDAFSRHKFVIEWSPHRACARSCPRFEPWQNSSAENRWQRKLSLAASSNDSLGNFFAPQNDESIEKNFISDEEGGDRSGANRADLETPPLKDPETDEQNHNAPSFSTMAPCVVVGTPTQNEDAARSKSELFATDHSARENTNNLFVESTRCQVEIPIVSVRSLYAALQGLRWYFSNKKDKNANHGTAVEVDATSTAEKNGSNGTISGAERKSVLARQQFSQSDAQQYLFPLAGSDKVDWALVLEKIPPRAFSNEENEAAARYRNRSLTSSRRRVTMIVGIAVIAVIGAALGVLIIYLSQKGGGGRGGSNSVDGGGSGRFEPGRDGGGSDNGSGNGGSERGGENKNT